MLPCTGRPLASLPPLVAQLPGIRYAITANGAAVWDMGTDPLGAVYSRYSDAARRPTHEPVLLERHCLPPETAREVFALYREYHGPLSFIRDGRLIWTVPVWPCFRTVISSAIPPRRDRTGRWPLPMLCGIGRMDDPPRPRSRKILYVLRQHRKAQAAARPFQAIPGVAVVQGSPDNIEVTAAGVDKGSALLALADLLGIPHENTLAVGDSENDRAMLEKAGVAAVMANGMPQIKAIGGIVSEPRQRPRRRCRAVRAARGALLFDRSAFLCNVYKLLCKTLCLLSITKLGRVVYTNITSAWWVYHAHTALPTP